MVPSLPLFTEYPQCLGASKTGTASVFIPFEGAIKEKSHFKILFYIY